MAWLKQKLFGSSSERRIDSYPGQMGLFDLEEEKPLELIEPEIVVLPKRPRKKKPTLAEQFNNIPTRQVTVDTLSKENPDMVFTSVGHLINKEMLQDCHDKMDGDKAVGIDGITREEYARNLEENLDALVESLKRKSYKGRCVVSSQARVPPSKNRIL